MRREFQKTLRTTAMTTDNPRTNSEVYYDPSPGCGVVSDDFARQLERELNAERELADALAQALNLEDTWRDKSGHEEDSLRMAAFKFRNESLAKWKEARK